MRTEPTPPSLNMHTTRLFKDLVASARHNGLVLFVGSGINGGAIPKWSGLLNTLLTQAITHASPDDSRIHSLTPYLVEWCTRHFDVCAQASILKKIFGQERYRLEIQDALYKNAPGIEAEVGRYCDARQKGRPPTAGNHELLWRVAQLCSLSDVKAVATFNFDTLLERAINACRVKYARAYFGDVAVEEDVVPPSKEIIPVFHVHGLLSPPKTFLRNRAESVVFSYDEYFDKNADPLSWETATSLHLLRQFCTLWIGASLKDWNMLRLLDAARSGRKGVNSYCLQTLQEAEQAMALATAARPDQHWPAKEGQPAEWPHMWPQFREVAMRLQATLFDTVGLNLLIGGETFAALPETLAEFVTKPLATAHQSAQL